MRPAAGRSPLVVALAFVALAASSAGADAADAARGQALFAQCVTCHGEAGAGTDRGPPLVGIVGRAAGKAAEFRYSRALAQSKLVWDEQTLADYLVDPQVVVPGNRMPFAGFDTKDDGLDVVAYLKKLETKVSQ